MNIKYKWSFECGCVWFVCKTQVDKCVYLFRCLRNATNNIIHWWQVRWTGQFRWICWCYIGRWCNWTQLRRRWNPNKTIRMLPHTNSPIIYTKRFVCNAIIIELNESCIECIAFYWENVKNCDFLRLFEWDDLRFLLSLSAFSSLALISRDRFGTLPYRTAKFNKMKEKSK